MTEKSYRHAEYDRLVDQTVERIRELGALKGGEYAGDDDRLANFRRNGDQAGLPMETIWRVYAAKHWDAIMQYERDLREGKNRERMEPIAGRVDDLIVYLILFKAMIEERETIPMTPPPTSPWKDWSMIGYWWSPEESSIYRGRTADTATPVNGPVPTHVWENRHELPIIRVRDDA